MNNLLRVLLVIVFTLGFSLTGCQSSSQAPQIDKAAPDFELTSLDGQSLSLKDFRGKPVLLNFWATWCRYCIYEMPILQYTLEEFADEGLAILAVNVGESPDTARDFIEYFGYTFIVPLDINRDVYLQYNVRDLPKSYFIDSDGILRAIKIGAFISNTQLNRYIRMIIS